MFSKHRKLCRALYSGYSVIELNKTVIEMNKFCSLSVKHIICSLTPFLLPGYSTYWYWDFVPWDFVLFILGFCPLWFYPPEFCPLGFCPLGFCPYPECSYWSSSLLAFGRNSFHSHLVCILIVAILSHIDKILCGREIVQSKMTLVWLWSVDRLQVVWALLRHHSHLLHRGDPIVREQ